MSACITPWPYRHSPLEKINCSLKYKHRNISYASNTSVRSQRHLIPVSFLCSWETVLHIPHHPFIILSSEFDQITPRCKILFRLTWEAAKIKHTCCVSSQHPCWIFTQTWKCGEEIAFMTICYNAIHTPAAPATSRANEWWWHLRASDDRKVWRVSYL